MNIKTTLDKYIIKGNYFDPDYGRENEVLTEFKVKNLILSKEQILELIEILESDAEIAEKYFVADLLYLYDEFDKHLFESMISAAINHSDPSFNRIFLQPCLNVFGVKAIAENLAEKFNSADIGERIGISSLIYWLRPNENGETEKLHSAILETANRATNLIELYHYKLIYSDKIKDSHKIPNNADELIKAIKGQEEYEDLLFNKLNWRRTAVQ